MHVSAASTLPASEGRRSGQRSNGRGALYCRKRPGVAARERHVPLHHEPACLWQVSALVTSSRPAGDNKSCIDTTTMAEQRDASPPLDDVNVDEVSLLCWPS